MRAILGHTIVRTFALASGIVLLAGAIFGQSELLIPLNSQNQDVYGRVVDQSGQPITGAKVTGTMLRMRGFDVGEKVTLYTTTTDAAGNFEFRNIRGWKFGLSAEKPGYVWEQRARVEQRPNSENRTSSTQRTILTLWKLAGAQPMIHAETEAYVPCDGTPTHFDLVTGQQVKSGGDLIVRLIRTPLQINIQHPFDWEVSFEIPDGGLAAITDIYPYLAPEQGYQPKVTHTVRAHDPKPSPFFDREYYFKARGGKAYGHVRLKVVADYQPPPTYVGLDFYTNPTGSRILEFDPATATIIR